MIRLVDDSKKPLQARLTSAKIRSARWNQLLGLCTIFLSGLQMLVHSVHLYYKMLRQYGPKHIFECFFFFFKCFSLLLRFNILSSSLFEFFFSTGLLWIVQTFALWGLSSVGLHDQQQLWSSWKHRPGFRGSHAGRSISVASAGGRSGFPVGIPVESRECPEFLRPFDRKQQSVGSQMSQDVGTRWATDLGATGGHLGSDHRGDGKRSEKAGWSGDRLNR